MPLKGMKGRAGSSGNTISVPSEEYYQKKFEEAQKNTPALQPSTGKTLKRLGKNALIDVGVATVGLPVAGYMTGKALGDIGKETITKGPEAGGEMAVKKLATVGKMGKDVANSFIQYGVDVGDAIQTGSMKPILEGPIGQHPGFFVMDLAGMGGVASKVGKVGARSLGKHAAAETMGKAVKVFEALESPNALYRKGKEALMALPDEKVIGGTIGKREIKIPIGKVGRGLREREAKSVAQTMNNINRNRQRMERDAIEYEWQTKPLAEFKKRFGSYPNEADIKLAQIRAEHDLYDPIAQKELHQFEVSPRAQAVYEYITTSGEKARKDYIKNYVEDAVVKRGITEDVAIAEAEQITRQRLLKPVAYRRVEEQLSKDLELRKKFDRMEAEMSGGQPTEKLQKASPRMMTLWLKKTDPERLNAMLDAEYQKLEANPAMTKNLRYVFPLTKKAENLEAEASERYVGDAFTEYIPGTRKEYTGGEVATLDPYQSMVRVMNQNLKEKYRKANQGILLDVAEKYKVSRDLGAGDMPNKNEVLFAPGAPDVRVRNAALRATRTAEKDALQAIQKAEPRAVSGVLRTIKREGVQERVPMKQEYTAKKQELGEEVKYTSDTEAAIRNNIRRVEEAERAITKNYNEAKRGLVVSEKEAKKTLKRIYAETAATIIPKNRTRGLRVAREMRKELNEKVARNAEVLTESQKQILEQKKNYLNATQNKIGQLQKTKEKLREELRLFREQNAGERQFIKSAVGASKMKQDIGAYRAVQTGNAVTDTAMNAVSNSLKSRRYLIDKKYTERMAQVSPKAISQILGNVFKSDFTNKKELPVAAEVVLRLFDVGLDMWRVAVLRFRPLWWAYNVLGTAALTALYTLNNPRGMVKAMPKLFAKKWRELLPAEVMNAGFSSEFKSTSGVSQGMLGKALESFIGDSGAYIKTTMPNGAEVKVPDYAAREWNWLIRKFNYLITGQPILKLNEASENLFRSAIALAETDKIARENIKRAGVKGAITNEIIDRGMEDLLKDPRKSMQVSMAVGDWVFNYWDLSPVERKYLRRIAPFYSWVSNITKFTLWTMPAKNPIKTMILAHTLKAAEDAWWEDMKELGIEKDDMPEYMRGAIPIGQDEKTGEYKFINLRAANPFSTIEDLGKIFFSNPFIRKAIEAYLGQDLMTGRKFTDPTVQTYQGKLIKTDLATGKQEIVKRVTQPLGEMVMTNIPQYNIARDFYWASKFGGRLPEMHDTSTFTNPLPRYDKKGKIKWSTRNPREALLKMVLPLQRWTPPTKHQKKKLKRAKIKSGMKTLKYFKQNAGQEDGEGE